MIRARRCPVSKAAHGNAHPAVRIANAQMRLAPLDHLGQRFLMSEGDVPGFIEGIDHHFPVRIQHRVEPVTHVESFQLEPVQFGCNFGQIAAQIGQALVKADPHETAVFLNPDGRCAHVLQAGFVEFLLERRKPQVAAQIVDEAVPGAHEAGAGTFSRFFDQPGTAMLTHIVPGGE